MENIIHEINIDGYVRYVVKVTKKESHFVDFIVYEISGWGMDCSYTIDETEVVMNGCIKWDGCSHITFGDSDRYMHLCGKHHWDDFVAMIPQVYDFIKTQIADYNQEVAE
jgi:hypothetical protein